jgi:hypothetical protein
MSLKEIFFTVTAPTIWVCHKRSQTTATLLVVVMQRYAKKKKQLDIQMLIKIIPILQIHHHKHITNRVARTSCDGIVMILMGILQQNFMTKLCIYYLVGSFSSTLGNESRMSEGNTAMLVSTSKRSAALSIRYSVRAAELPYE